MKCITLKEFMNKQGYYPHSTDKNKSSRAFAKLVGLTDSDISKAYNGKSLDGSVRWNKLVTFVESYGYHLIPSNPVDYMNNNIIKENDLLKTELQNCYTKINLQEQQLKDYELLLSICKRIVLNEEHLKELKKVKCKR